MLKSNRNPTLHFLLLFALSSLLAAQNASAVTGPGGTSGGDTHGGRIVELQRERDITRHKAYVMVMKPVIAQLKAKVPRFGEEFEAAAKSLTWYLLPVANQTVPANVKCIPMQTQQAGRVENRREVWIDTRKPKGTRELGELMVHEVTVRIGSSDLSDCDRHQFARDFVFEVLNNASEEKLADAIARLMWGRDNYPTATEIQAKKTRYAKYQSDYIAAITEACTKAPQEIAENQAARKARESSTELSATDPVSAHELEASLAAITYAFKLRDAYSSSEVLAATMVQNEIGSFNGPKSLRSQFIKDSHFFGGLQDEIFRGLRALGTKSMSGPERANFLNGFLKTCETVQTDPTSLLPKHW